MSPQHIENDDVVCRLVFNPKDFVAEGLGVLSIGQHLYFSSKHSYLESVNCRRLIKIFPDDLHEQGAKKAKADTVTRLAQGKSESHYKGYTPILVSN